MKHRKGFVSNSSSSSFIVVFNVDQKPCPHCGRMDTTFEDFKRILEASENYNDDNKFVAQGVEAVINVVNNQWFGDEDRKEMIEKIEKYRDMENKIVICGEISYHNQEIWEILRNMVRAGTIEVIEDGEGSLKI